MRTFFLLLLIPMLFNGCDSTRAPAQTPVRSTDLTEPATFPLRISNDGRYLIDAAGKPFFYQADTPWMLFFRLPMEEVVAYMRRRKAQGFNALQIMLTGFRNTENVHGDRPFPENNDIGQPNEAFFKRVDSIVSIAQAENLLLALTPAWSGCCREGYAGQDDAGDDLPLNANGVEKARAYGEYLGRRYGKHDHLMWIIGGDNDPFNAYKEIAALAAGLDATNGDQLMTYHAASTHSSTDVWPADTDWLNLSMVYTYHRGFDRAWNKVQPDVYEVSRTEWRKNELPFFLGESTYEGEHTDAEGNADLIRRQTWYAALSGATGHAYGSPNWKLEPEANWRALAELPGAESMHLIPEWLGWVGWPEVAYDFADELIATGRGRYAADELAVAITRADGKRLLAYLPEGRAFALAGEGWSGEWIAADGSERREHYRAGAAPGRGDWILAAERK